MSDKINRTWAAALFDATRVTIDRMVVKPVVHTKSIFIGYADVTVTRLHSIGGTLTDVGDKETIRGIQLKVLNGAPYIDMPSEPAEVNGQTKHFPQFYPRSGELRAVLTAQIFSIDAVTKAMADAVALAASQSTGSEASAPSSNPFRQA